MIDYVYNPFTDNLDAVNKENQDLEIDGGFANSVYLINQNINGGGA